MRMMECSCQFKQPLWRRITSILINKRKVKDWCHMFHHFSLTGPQSWSCQSRQKWHGWRWQHFTPWENTPDRCRARLSAVMQLESYAIWTVKKTAASYHKIKAPNYISSRDISKAQTSLWGMMSSPIVDSNIWHHGTSKIQSQNPVERPVRACRPC